MGAGLCDVQFKDPKADQDVMLRNYSVQCRKPGNPKQDTKRIVRQSRIKTKGKVVISQRVSRVYQTNLWLYCHRLRKSDQCSDKEQTENMWNIYTEIKKIQ